MIEFYSLKINYLNSGCQGGSRGELYHRGQRWQRGRNDLAQLRVLQLRHHQLAAAGPGPVEQCRDEHGFSWWERQLPACGQPTNSSCGQYAKPVTTNTGQIKIYKSLRKHQKYQEKRGFQET